MLPSLKCERVNVIEVAIATSRKKRKKEIQTAASFVGRRSIGCIWTSAFVVGTICIGDGRQTVRGQGAGLINFTLCTC